MMIIIFRIKIEVMGRTDPRMEAETL